MHQNNRKKKEKKVGWGWGEDNVACTCQHNMETFLTIILLLLFFFFGLWEGSETGPTQEGGVQLPVSVRTHKTHSEYSDPSKTLHSFVLFFSTFRRMTESFLHVRKIVIVVVLPTWVLWGVTQYMQLVHWQMHSIGWERERQTDRWTDGRTDG